VLLVRGTATVTDVDGWAPEYLQAATRSLGAEGAEAFVSQFDGRPIRMHRIGVRPSWGRTLDVLGGIQGGAH
jgi:hypothetical protein